MSESVSGFASENLELTAAELKVITIAIAMTVVVVFMLDI